MKPATDQHEEIKTSSSSAVPAKNQVLEPGVGDLPVIRQKVLKKGKLLGCGNFASVYKGRLALRHGKVVRVAIKEPVDDPEKLAWTS